MTDDRGTGCQAAALWAEAMVESLLDTTNLGVEYPAPSCALH